MTTIELTLPAQLEMRDILLLVVGQMCIAADLAQPVHFAIVSSAAEIFNLIVNHAYVGVADGRVHLVLRMGATTWDMETTDHGRPYDLTSAPQPDAAPAHGLQVSRFLLDSLEYTAGPPNHWRLVKSLNLH